MGLPVWSSINYGQGPRAGSTSPRPTNPEPTAVRRSPIRRGRSGPRAALRSNSTSRLMVNIDNHNNAASDGNTVGAQRGGGGFRRPQNPSPTWRREYIQRVAEQRDTGATTEASQPQLPPALAAQFTNVIRRIDADIAHASRLEAAYTARPTEPGFTAQAELITALRRSANFRADAGTHRMRVLGYETQALRGQLTVQPTTTAMTVREVVFEMRDIENRVSRELERVQQGFAAVSGMEGLVEQSRIDADASERAFNASRREAETANNGNWPLRENSSLSLNASLSDAANFAAITQERYSSGFGEPTSQAPMLAEINLLGALRREINSPNPPTYPPFSNLSEGISRVPAPAQTRSIASPPPPPLLAAGRTGTEGLGDRIRSPSPMPPDLTATSNDESQSRPSNDPRAWDSLLNTVAPDDVLPSADSTFTAATASFEAGSNSGILTRNASRSATTLGSGSGSAPNSGLSSRSSWTSQNTDGNENNENENDDDCDFMDEYRRTSHQLARYPINPHYRPSERSRRRVRRGALPALADSSSSASSSIESSIESMRRRRRGERRSESGATTTTTTANANRMYSPSETRQIEESIRAATSRSGGDRVEQQLNEVFSDPTDRARARRMREILSSIIGRFGLSEEEADSWVVEQIRTHGSSELWEEAVAQMAVGLETEVSSTRPTAESRTGSGRSTSTGAGLLPRRRSTEMAGAGITSRRNAGSRLILEQTASPGRITDNDDDDDLDVNMEDVEMRMVVDGDVEATDGELDAVIGRVIRRATSPTTARRRDRAARRVGLFDYSNDADRWMPMALGLGPNPLTVPTSGTTSRTTVDDQIGRGPGAAALLASITGEQQQQQPPVSAVREEQQRTAGGDAGPERN